METSTPSKIDVTGKWAIDPAHTNIDFAVDHLVISRVNGSFEKFDGSISNENGAFEDSQIEFRIDTASISTRNEMRDTHLKSDDFFNSEKFPHIQLRSSSVTQNGEGQYTLRGDLTIRDVTRPVEFDLKWGGMAKDGYGNTKMGFRARTEIDRFDYNLKWNQLTEAGGMTVGRKVEIVANLQFAKQ